MFTELDATKARFYSIALADRIKSALTYAIKLRFGQIDGFDCIIENSKYKV